MNAAQKTFYTSVKLKLTDFAIDSCQYIVILPDHSSNQQQKLQVMQKCYKFKLNK